MLHCFVLVKKGDSLVDICENCGTIRTYVKKPMVSRQDQTHLVAFYRKGNSKKVSIIEPICSDETKKTKKINEKILSLRKQGYTFSEIGERVALSESKVYKMFLEIQLSKEESNHIEIKRLRRIEFKRLVRTKPELFNKEVLESIRTI